MKLNLGCGIKKLKGWVNIDYNSEYKPDRVVNLNKLPLPFKSNSVTEINCSHTIEHINDIVGLMKEFYRVSKNGCIIRIRYPHFSDRSAFADPTHRHYLSHASLLYFENKHLNQPEALTHEINLQTIKHYIHTGNWLKEKLVNINPDFWERHRFLCLLIGMKEVEVIFKVMK